MSGGLSIIEILNNVAIAYITLLYRDNLIYFIKDANRFRFIKKALIVRAMK